MPARLLAVSALAVAGCWTGHEAAPESPQPPRPPHHPVHTGPLNVELRVSPTTVSMTTLGALHTGFVVTNTSPETLDPKLDQAELLIDGVPNNMWANTNGNGGREPEWYALPPGGHVERDYTIAETMFDKPGDYTLVLRVSGIASAPVQVHITP